MRDEACYCDWLIPLATETENMCQNFEVPIDRSEDGKLPDGFFKQLRELQDRVSELSSEAGRPAPKGSAGEVPIAPKDSIRNILKIRATRRAIFGPALFGEPSWDMLLELYDAHFNGRRECISSLCIASGVPSTTALRWLGNLIDEGWIIRTPDPKDARRSFVELTDKGIDAMSKVFAAG